MARSKLDVENIGWSEQIKDNILVSGSIIVTGSIKISGLGSDSSVILVGPDNDITASDTLYIDEVNTRVGMGISTPQEDFHIHGNDATLRLGNGLNSGEHSPKLQFSELANSDGAMTYGMSIEYNGAQNRLELKRHANNESGQAVMTFPRNTSEVGIATPGNPEATLHVYGGNSGETFSNVDGIAIENAGSSPTFYAFQVATAGAGKSFTITNAGTVGIGTTSPSLKLDVEGDVRIGNHLALNCDGTSDPSLFVNHAHIYSKLVSGHAEIFVRDSNGNVTQISPHTAEGEWQYFSRNTRTGKVVRVNMEKMIRKLEEITGESFMEEWYEDPSE